MGIIIFKVKLLQRGTCVIGGGGGELRILLTGNYYIRVAFIIKKKS